MIKKEELSNIISEINSLKEKISKLEKENIEINKVLSQKNGKGDNNNSIIKEINNIKNHQDQFEASLLQEFTNFKNEIINNINEKNTKFIENFNENNNIENCDIKSDDLENNNDDDIKKNPKKEKILKHNYSKDSIKSTILVQKDEYISKELSQFWEELNKNDLKLSSLESKYDSLSSQYFSDLKNINNIIEAMKNYQKKFENFKENNKFNVEKFKKDFEHNAQNNKLFITDVSNLIEEFQKKLNFFEKNNVQLNTNIYERNNDLDKILNYVNQVLNNEMNEFHLEINKQIKDHSNEIETFEKFISQEHEKFVEYIQNRLDESISSIKKLFDFNINDIKKLNKKIEIVQENIKKVRTDVFQNINDSEEFLENKYQSLFRLINKE